MAKKKQEVKKELPCDAINYFVFLRCENCGNALRYTIPRGQTIKRYVKRNHCFICKCRNLYKNFSFSIFHF